MGHIQIFILIKFISLSTSIIHMNSLVIFAAIKIIYKENKAFIANNYL